MLNNISWAEYCYALIILLIFYYTIVGWLYYRADALRLFQGRHITVGNKPVWIRQPANTDHQPLHDQDTPLTAEQEEQIAQSLIDELNAFFEQSKKTKCIKQEFLFGLKKICQKYPVVKYSMYKQAINNLIVVQSENICSVHVEAGEAEQVWLG